MSDPTPNVIMDEGTGRELSNLVGAITSTGWTMGSDFDVRGSGACVVLEDVTLVLYAEDRQMTVPEENTDDE